MTPAALVIVAAVAAVLLWLGLRRPAAAAIVAAPIQAVPPTLDAQFVSAGRTYGINPAWLKGIARQESNLGKSRVGPERPNPSLGLMQINPVNFWRRPEKKITDWQNDDWLSIAVACEILSDYRARYGWKDAEHLLAAYNWGPEHVVALEGGGRNVPRDLPPQVRAYVERIKNFSLRFSTEPAFTDWKGRSFA